VAPAPPILIVAIAASELSSPRTAAILKTAHEVLGRDMTVQVEVFQPDGTRGQAVNDHPTSAYAWLSWDYPEHRVAHLRCYVPEDQRWIQRDVTFAEGDPDSERGRTVGFVIASIFVEVRSPQPQPAERVPAIPQSFKPSSGRRTLIAAAASLAAPGDATSFGAWVGAERALSRIFWLGLAGDARLGAVNQAQASTRFLSIGALATVRLFPQRGPGWWGGQAFVGAEQLTFIHLSEDDPAPVTETAWVPKVEMLVHGNFDLSGSSFLFVDMGANYRFGSTDVYVHQLVKAHIPAWVGIGRVGVGTRF
jgi:hypothetical protein